jgi:hypothetical protein
MRPRTELPQQRVCEPRAFHLEGGAPGTVAEEGARCAVLVVHGMGQQLQFETLDQVVTGLYRAEEAATGVPIAQQPRTEVRIVRLGEECLARAEMKLRRRSREARVDLYEGYWAPLMEGQVNLRDVIRFLLLGGWNGLRYSLRAFRRRMFGSDVTLGIVWRTPLYLFLAFCTIAALFVINAVATAAAGSVLAPDFLSDAFLRDATLVLGAMLLLVAGFGVAMAKAKRMAYFFALLGTLLLAGFVFALLVVLHGTGHGPGLAWPRFLERLVGPLAVVLWLGVFGFSLFVRQLLVQYLGDVAAYVAPHTLDRFFDLREKVRERVLRTARAIYRARAADGRYLYDRIAVVAHSLGSVVSYDCLNALINEDLMAPASGKADIVDRTMLLLTFGSPLDKTAFVFQTQAGGAGATLHNLAMANQPLIQDYAHRRFRWRNIWSRKDIISGSLDFYDDPQNPLYLAHRIRNEEDGAADVPLLAHTQYWGNPLLFKRLHSAIVYAKTFGP